MVEREGVTLSWKGLQTPVHRCELRGARALRTEACGPAPCVTARCAGAGAGAAAGRDPPHFPVTPSEALQAPPLQEYLLGCEDGEGRAWRYKQACASSCGGAEWRGDRGKENRGWEILAALFWLSAANP